MDNKSKDFVIINFEKNSNDYGLYIDTPLPPPSAKRRYNRIEIAGKNDIVTGTDAYDDVSYTLTGYVFSDGKSFNNNRIYELFKGAKTLEISRYEGFYFNVNEIEEIIPESSYNGTKVLYSVTMQLAPFKYAKEPSTTEIGKEYTAVENTSSIYSEPVIQIKMKKSTSTILKGDVDMDGKITAADAALVMDEIANIAGGGEPTFTPEQFEAADMDGDGKLTAADAAEILRIYSENTKKDPASPSQNVIINTNGAKLFVGIPSEVVANGFTVTIDCGLHLIYYTDLSGNMVNILHYSSLDLPLLHEGTNYMKYTGDNVESVTVTINERWL